MQVRVDPSVQFPFHHHEKKIAMFSAEVFAASLIFAIIICRHEGVAGDFNVNCKTKVRNMWLKYCVNNGVRSKRDASQVDSEDHFDPGPASRGLDKRQIFSPQATAALVGIAAPMITEMLFANGRESRGQGYVEKMGGPDVNLPGYPAGFGFPPPASGDDLGMGLSYNDLEDLYEEIVGRLPRAAKNKDETIKMITAYAARCCNENLSDDNCSNPAVINCP